jgi:hypothetical protein
MGTTIKTLTRMEQEWSDWRPTKKNSLHGIIKNAMELFQKSIRPEVINTDAIGLVSEGNHIDTDQHYFGAVRERGGTSEASP